MSAPAGYYNLYIGLASQRESTVAVGHCYIRQLSSARVLITYRIRALLHVSMQLQRPDRRNRELKYASTAREIRAKGKLHVTWRATCSCFDRFSVISKAVERIDRQGSRFDTVRWELK